MKLLLSVFVIAVLAQTVELQTWDYDTPSSWGDDYPTCNSDKQSPIDVVTSTAELNTSLTLAPTGFNTSLAWNVQNNGESVYFTVPPASFSAFSLTAYDLYNWVSNTWYFIGFHFHWGTSDSTGSEHTVDGVQYPMELHLVLGNSKYAPNQITAYDDGVIVMSFFFEIGSSNSAFENVVNTLGSVPNEGDTTTTSAFAVTDLLGSEWHSGAFYSLKGSTTEPGCDEVVTWYIFTNKIVISSSQMDAMRTSLYADAGSVKLDHNWRPVQSLNSRTIYTNNSNALTYNIGLAVLVACLIGKLV